MSALRDLLGSRFGRLLVLARAGSNQHKKALWACQCACGKHITAVGASLLSGKTSSCGCFRAQVTSEKNRRHGCGSAGARSPEYVTWLNMRNRCRNPKADEQFDADFTLVTGELQRFLPQLVQALGGEAFKE